MITAIVAYGKNREIGATGGLIFKLSSDLKRFKEVTMGHPMIMGRKTYESIGRPLPGRTSIVVTRNPDFHPEGVVVAHDLMEAIGKASMIDSDIFVIGGGEIYRQAMPMLDRLDVTYVDAEFPDADTYFPEHPEFQKYIVTGKGEENGLKWEYRQYDK